MSRSHIGLVCVVFTLLSSTSCRETPSPPAGAPVVQAMQELVTPERFERLRADCPYSDFLVLATAPKEIFAHAHGCSEEVADTTYYLYLDDTGKPLVVGRAFSIHPEQVGHAFIVSRDRLRSLTDRERPRLVRRYGPSAPCRLEPPYRPHDGWMERWDGEAFGVLLVGSYDELRGSLVVEVHAGEPSCDRMAGPPAHD